MAYMNQDKKTKIAAKLKAVIPGSWKYSLAVRHHSTLVLTIRSAPLDLVGEALAHNKKGLHMGEGQYYLQLNHHCLDHYFSGERLAQFKAIFAAMNEGNHDNSDAMTDYFDVGWYVDINIGQWNKPFVVTTQCFDFKKIAKQEIAKQKKPLHPKVQAYADHAKKMFATPPASPGTEAVVNLDALRNYIFSFGLTVEGLTKARLDTVRKELEADLSPENLTCDGELSDAAVDARLKELRAVQGDIAKIEYLLGW